MPTLFRLNEAEMIFERFDEEIVAIQLATGAYHSVSGSGVDAFLLLSAEASIPELAQVLASKYDASAATIEKDLEGFLDQLVKESIVVPHAGPKPGYSRASLAHAGDLLPYTPPLIEPFHELQDLLFIDPVHDVGAVGWPRQKPATSLSKDNYRYRPQSEATMIFERFDEETLAMNLGTGAYHSLTGSAEDIFLLLPEQPTVSEVIQALRTKYSPSESELSECVEQFLDSLVAGGLAERIALDSPPEKLRQLTLAKPGAAAAFVAPRVDTFLDHAAPVVTENTEPYSILSYERKRFRLNSGVIQRRAGTEAVVINLDRGLYYLLNTSAANVLQLVEQRPTASELVQALGRIYDVTAREITTAVLILLHNLGREGLICAEPASDGLRNLDIVASSTHEKYGPFSVEAYRDQQRLFLPFPVNNVGKPESSWSGHSLASLLRAYHREAQDRAGQTEANFRIAGKNIRIHCAGALRASELSLAFGHLAADAASSPDLTLYAWDCVSAGPARNSFLQGFLSDFYTRWDRACGLRGEVLPFHSEEVPVFYHPGPDILSVVDFENHAAYYLKRDAAPLPHWEVGSPFRTILHIWLSTQGMQFVHAAAVGCAAGGVVLAGKGGSGKSTTALACLNAGMRYASDDYCAVSTQTPLYVHSLYNSAKLRGKSDIERFPHLEERVWNAGSLESENGDKAIFFLSQSWSGPVCTGFPLRALLIPQVTGEPDSHLSECSEAKALLALSASTIAQLPMAGARDLSRLGGLVTQLPCYTLYLGTDIAQIPAVIQGVL